MRTSLVVVSIYNLVGHRYDDVWLSDSGDVCQSGRYRQGKRKSGSLSGCAFHRDLSSLQFNQLSSDRESQAGATKLPCCAAVSLAECLENIAKSCGRNTNPCIMDGNVDHLALFDLMAANGHSSLFRKF